MATPHRDEGSMPINSSRIGCIVFGKPNENTMMSASISNNDTYTESFLQFHKDQLDRLNIPSSLYYGIQYQLEQIFVPNNSNNNNGSNINNNNESTTSVDDKNETNYDLIKVTSRMNELVNPKCSTTTTTTTATENDKASCEGNGNRNRDVEILWDNPYGTIIVIPHICSWDISLQSSSLVCTNDGLFKTLYNLPILVLQHVFDGLNELSSVHSTTTPIDEADDDDDSRLNLCIAIVDHPYFWTRIILYNDPITATIRAALPAPPYYPQYWNDNDNKNDNEEEEADISGPFPFQYYHNTDPNNTTGTNTRKNSIQLSLGYVAPGILQQRYVAGRLPTIDLVPAYQFPNNLLTRALRYVMFYYHDIDQLSKLSGSFKQYVQIIQECYANFVHEMHLVRQQKLELLHGNNDTTSSQGPVNINDQSTTNEIKKLCVYTDANDPMGLGDPISGLEANSQFFTMVTDPKDADIVFSYKSLFVPNTPLYTLLQERNHHPVEDSSSNSTTTSHRPLYINQFPYEGAFVQKDHLAREVLKQHGLPRPFWSIESYDLDVHLIQFVGAALVWTNQQDEENEEADEVKNTAEGRIVDKKQATPVWILKPSTGTQSKGHVVTRSLAHALRVLDTNGTNRVAQKYIEYPVCYMGKKVDCRVIVIITNAQHEPQRMIVPTIYMHNTVYFRIANKEHRIDTSYNLADHESVLTATHLFDASKRTTDTALQPLPKFHETIRHLQATYSAFDWNNILLPKIQIMIRELWNGMTLAYPAMGQSIHSRAIYGVDVMFEIESDNMITPKLTEVTFCPANNAICDAYERDDDLYKSYNKEIFEALYLGIISKNITKLQ